LFTLDLADKAGELVLVSMLTDLGVGVLVEDLPPELLLELTRVLLATGGLLTLEDFVDVLELLEDLVDSIFTLTVLLEVEFVLVLSRPNATFA